MRKNKKSSLVKYIQTDFIVMTKGMLRGIILLVSLLFTLQNVAAQETNKISGVVKDDTGQPLIGATVVVKGTTNGTVTDINGRYSIESKSRTGVLVISYVGMEKQEVSFSGSGVKNVQLENGATALNEVVAVGYGTVKKRDLTGAVSSVKSDLIKLTPSVNPMEALQGRVAGLDITKTSGRAGQGVNMQLRGNRSITASGKPLFIIDGMPGDYETINPNDIESIEVLKDASSTAVYGSSGSNGVVIITTKKGEPGKLNVNFNSYVGYNGWSVLPEMNSGQQWIDTRILARKEAGVWQDSDEATFDAARASIENGELVNWAEALLQTGSVQNYSLSISSGTQKTQSYFSMNYSDEKGQYKNDEYKLFTSNMRLNHDVNKWFSTGINSQIAFAIQEKTSSKLANALRTNPFGTLYKADGSVNEYPIKDDNKQVNLLLNQNRDVYRDNSNNLNLYFQPYIRFSPIKGLTLESRLNANLYFSTKNNFVGYGSYQFYDAAGTGALNAPKEQLANYTSASIENNRSWGYTWENILIYNFKIAQDHDFTLTGVTTYADSQSERSKESAIGITSNTYYWTNLGAATGIKTVESGYSMGKNQGFVGRLNYSYLGRYLLSASVRHDGNSKLAKYVRWSTFPAVSVGWRISDEGFMESTRGWLDNLKFRVGYGETGAAGLNAYDSWSILQQGLMGLGNQTITKYSYPQLLSNQMLTWERSKNSNFGIDMALLNNRIELTADYYITNTEGVIWKQNIPITNGGFTAASYFQMNKNIAETKNEGIELALTTRNIVSKDFNWTSIFTFFKNNEKVTSLGDNASEFITNGDYTLHVGDPIKSYRAYNIIGVWQYGEEADAAVFGKLPGDLKVGIPNMTRESEGVWKKSYVQPDGTIAYNTYDATNKYSVNDNDKVIVGHNTPDWSFGFHNTFSWKAFDLSVYMYMRQGQMFYYEPISWYSSSGGAFPNHFNYWTSTNPSNDFPALNSSRNWTSDGYYTSKAYTDGSFFKIKNITLGYTLPVKSCKKLGIAGLRAYGTITNPLIVSNNPLLKNYDPEMNGDMDFPLTKQIVFGLNFSF